MSLQEHGKRYNHRCTTCSLAFATRKDLLIHNVASHMATSSECTETTCTTCGTNFHTVSLLKSHVSAGCPLSRSKEPKNTTVTKTMTPVGSSPEGKSHECKTCGARFAWAENLARHERSHLEDSCVCNLCGASFGSAASVKVHLWKVHNQQSSQHPVTAAAGVAGSTTSSSSVSINKSTSKLSQPTRTNVKIESTSSVKAASSSVDASSKQTTGSKDVEKKYHCTVCDKRFQYDFSYNAHMNMHSLNGELSADHKDDPVDVTLTFDPDRPFVCSACSAGFRYDFSLTAHRRSCAAVQAEAEALAGGGPITIAQFANLVQRGNVIGEDDPFHLDDGAEEAAVDLHNFSGFSDSEVRVVPLTQLPAGVLNFLMHNADDVDSDLSFDEDLEAVVDSEPFGEGTGSSHLVDLIEPKMPNKLKSKTTKKLTAKRVVDNNGLQLNGESGISPSSKKMKLSLLN